MNNSDILHALNDESILAQLDNSDFEDVLDDDDVEIDPTYNPDNHSDSEVEAPDEADEDDPALDADPGSGTYSSTNQGLRSKTKHHS